MTSANASPVTVSSEGCATAATSEISVTTEKDRVPVKAKLAYAMGGTTDMFGHWLYNNLANPVFNVFLGLSPTQVSL
ncbi:MAG: hypothetical protein JW940_10885, partial [Polyangiaceae bacterium]|nr:hypothetical protein [Polyangiaceae bacterium]